MGNTLKVTTTHLKDGYLKRGGPQTSDLYTMTEFITRHDEILTITTVVDDPVYQDEPYVQSTTYSTIRRRSVQMETCNASAFAENGGTDRHYVPHFLPGQNTRADRVAEGRDWVPAAPRAAASRRLYPGVSRRCQTVRRPQPRTVPASRSAVALATADQQRRARATAQVHVLPVQGNVYMLIADGMNVAASVGPDGMMLVNTGAAAMTDKVLAALGAAGDGGDGSAAPNRCSAPTVPAAWGWASPYINAVISSPLPPRPLRYIVNTSAAAEHVGGNEKIAATGFFPRGGGFGGAVATSDRSASVIAHENVLNRMSAPVNKQPPAYPEPRGRPTPTSTSSTSCRSTSTAKRSSSITRPAANTDGDSLVFFRHSEVITPATSSRPSAIR